MYLANTAAYAGPQVGFRFTQGVIVTSANAVLIPPLTATIVGSGQYVCGDTGVPYEAILSDTGNTTLDLSGFVSGYLHLQYANGTLALTAPVTITDQTVPANLGLVSVAGVAGGLTRASQVLHEVRMQRADGSVVTFRGSQKLSLLLPYSTP